LNIKKYLLVSTPLWIKHVSDEQILGFVENVMVAVFKAASPLPHPELCTSALQGLSQAMKLPSPTHHLWSLLSEATGKIFDLLPNKIRRNDLELYVSIAKCLSEMTDDEANRVAQITESNLEKAAFVRLYLVSQGRLPLMGLMGILGVAVRHRDRDPVAWMVMQSLYQARTVGHANAGKASLGDGRSGSTCLPALLTCNCFLNLKTGLVLLDPGELLSPQTRSTFNEKISYNS